MSDYYTVGSVGTRNTTARAETVQAQLQAVDDGFALLPDKLPLQQDRVTYSADTGSANAYVVTLAKVPPAYVAGMRVTFKAANANTTASTINVNSLGAKAIQTWEGSAISSGTIAANQLVTVQYDGTAFRIMSMHGGTSISTLAGISADITTVAGISSNVTSVAGNASNINTVAGISANVTTVAGISANVTSVAGNTSNINTVAGIDADVTTVAANVADVTNFADVYIGPSATDPTTRTDGSALQAGDIYFNTGANNLNIYTGAAWVPITTLTLASQAQAEAGTNNTAFMSPLRTAQAIAALAAYGSISPYSAISADPNPAVAFTRYLVDTTSAVTVTLPASPTAGDWIEIIRDGANDVTVDRNGNNIAGSAADLTIDTDGYGCILLYTSSGWIVSARVWA